MSYDNSIGLEDDINSMLSNITNEKKRAKGKHKKMLINFLKENAIKKILTR